MKIHKHKNKHDKGFTLVELIVVVAILGVLMAVLVPQYIQYVDKSREKILIANTYEMKNAVSVYSINYARDDWWGPYSQYWTNNSGHTTGENSVTSLNNYIESQWEIYRDSGFGNGVGFENPYSGYSTILDFEGYLKDAKIPALFMTANDGYKHEKVGQHDKFAGTVVVYFDVDTTDANYWGRCSENQYVNFIEFYYFDKNGDKSNLHLRYGEIT